jgi:hypothetical protein
VLLYVALLRKRVSTGWLVAGTVLLAGGAHLAGLL